MRKILIPLLGLLIFSNLSLAAEEVDISSYTIGIEGSGTFMFGSITAVGFYPWLEFTDSSDPQESDSARRFGLNSYIDYGRYHSFDWGMGMAKFTPDSGVTEQESRQQEFLFIYTNKHFRIASLKCGVHNISAYNSGGLDVNTGMLAGGFKRSGPLNLELSYYFSSYDTPSISAHQLTPCLGFSFNNNRLYSKSSFNYILLSDNQFFEDKEFLSLQQDLDFYYKKLTLSCSLFMGDSALAVLGNGYSVINDLSVYGPGYGLGAAFSFNKNVLIRFQYHRRKYRDVEFDERVISTNAYTGLVLSD